jgi:hypothetical protein
MSLLIKGRMVCCSPPNSIIHWKIDRGTKRHDPERVDSEPGGVGPFRPAATSCPTLRGSERVTSRTNEVLEGDIRGWAGSWSE